MGGMTSQITTSPLYIQLFIQAQVKENIESNFYPT